VSLYISIVLESNRRRR